MTAFKPYRYEGCMIRSPKNKHYLEGLATALAWYPAKLKRTMHNTTQKYNDVTYLLLRTDKVKLVVGVEERVKGKPTLFRVHLEEL
jgi:hypothetical protein